MKVIQGNYSGRNSSNSKRRRDVDGDVIGPSCTSNLNQNLAESVCVRSTDKKV